MTSYRNTRICIYARTSATCHNDDGSLLAEQIDRLKIWCRLNEAIIVDTIVETESGTARSSFQAMIAAATSNRSLRRHPGDVLVASASRSSDAGEKSGSAGASESSRPLHRGHRSRVDFNRFTESLRHMTGCGPRSRPHSSFPRPPMPQKWGSWETTAWSPISQAPRKLSIAPPD